MATVTDPQGGVTTYTYDAAGNLVKTTNPNATSEIRQYDSLNRLTYIEDDGPSGVTASYHYILGPTGRRDAVIENTGRRVDYTFDLLDRLLEEKITDPVVGNRTIDYAYDAVGNRLSMNDSVDGNTIYTYDANDRLLTATSGNQVTKYTYDDNGNTLSTFTSAVDQATYAWDSQNRLIGAKITDATGTHEFAYAYDADGNRVSQISDGQETRDFVRRTAHSPRFSRSIHLQGR